MPRILIPEVETEEIPAARKAADDLRRMRRNLCQQMLDGHQAIFTRLWQSHNATPAEILSELGTEAKAFFVEGGQLVTLLLTTGTVHMGESEYTPPVPYYPQTDGTVTTTRPTPA